MQTLHPFTIIKPKTKYKVPIAIIPLQCRHIPIFHQYIFVSYSYTHICIYIHLRPGRSTLPCTKEEVVCACRLICRSESYILNLLGQLARVCGGSHWHRERNNNTTPVQSSLLPHLFHPSLPTYLLPCLFFSLPNRPITTPPVLRSDLLLTTALPPSKSSLGKGFD